MSSGDVTDSNSGRKDLGNYSGPIHSGLAAHFPRWRLEITRKPLTIRLNAFLPGHMWTWISHVARYWFHKKHDFL